MLSVLIKKQLLEINAGFFVNRKKGTRKSKLAIVLGLLGFAFLIVFVLGGLFLLLANLLCEPFCGAGLDWLYFALMGLVAIALGVFGSVFNTYASLYQAKDNELLLSLPIPSKTIIESRLVTVFIMGLFYSSIAFLPAIYEYCTKVRFSMGPFVLLLDISLIDLFLSCVLGYGVAQITKRTKGKSYITVIISLIFIALYYYVYFMAIESIKDILSNPQVLAQSMEGFTPIVIFGRVGEGNLFSMGSVTLLSAILCLIVVKVLSSSFFSLSQKETYTSSNKKTKKEVVQKSPFQALLRKEMAKFTSSANYMLNCGLGSVILLLIAGVLVFKGEEIFIVLQEVFHIQNIETVIFIIMSFSGIVMIDITAPSVSLEGKNLWIVRTLPIDTWKILLAKLHVHWLVSMIPFGCAWIVFLIIGRPTILMAIISLVLPILFIVFTSCFGLLINCLKPNVNWVNEVVVIKQTLSVFIALLVPMMILVGFAGGYFAVGYEFTNVYLYSFMILFTVLDIILYIWLQKKGVRRFEKI